MRAGLPVWAATGDGFLSKWQPPAEAREITIFADNDHSCAGQAAAYTLAKRLIAEAKRVGLDRRIIVEMPKDVGTDFNDVLKQQQGGEQ